MGADWSARMILGVRVEDADLYTRTEENRPSCSCPEAAGQRFCPACGTRVETRSVSVVAPTAFLVQLGAALGVPPDRALDRLDEVRFHGGIRFFDNAAACSCSEDERTGAQVIGFLLEEADEYAGRRMAFVDAGTIAFRASSLLGLLERLGLSSRTVGVFLSLRVSI